MKKYEKALELIKVGQYPRKVSVKYDNDRTHRRRDM